MAAHLLGSHPVMQREDGLQDGLMVREPSIHMTEAGHPTAAETAPRLGLQALRLLPMACQMGSLRVRRLPVMVVVIPGDQRHLRTNNHPLPTTIGLQINSLLMAGARMLMTPRLREHISRHRLLRL